MHKSILGVFDVGVPQAHLDDLLRLEIEGKLTQGLVSTDLFPKDPFMSKLLLQASPLSVYSGLTCVEQKAYDSFYKVFIDLGSTVTLDFVLKANYSDFKRGYYWFFKGNLNSVGGTYSLLTSREALHCALPELLDYRRFCFALRRSYCIIEVILDEPILYLNYCLISKRKRVTLLKLRELELKYSYEEISASFRRKI